MLVVFNEACIKKKELLPKYTKCISKSVAYWPVKRRKTRSKRVSNYSCGYVPTSSLLQNMWTGTQVTIGNEVSHTTEYKLNEVVVSSYVKIGRRVHHMWISRKIFINLVFSYLFSFLQNWCKWDNAKLYFIFFKFYNIKLYRIIFSLLCVRFVFIGCGHHVTCMHLWFL